MRIEIPYTLKRQKRKTIALYIHDTGLEVRAPYRATITEIENFVTSKREWIERNLAKQESRSENRQSFELYYGSKIPYRGIEYPIIGVSGNKISFDNAFRIPLNLSSDQIKYACIQIYRLLGKRDFINKVLEYTDRMGVMPSAVKVSNAKTRWGSCSAKKSINLSWRLLMAEDDVIDYVVVHELAHLKEMNHSPRFWAVVASIVPDYMQRKKKLEALQNQLSVQDWD